MKTNTIILSLTLGFVALTGLMTCSTYRVQHLQNQFTKENFLSSDVQYDDVGLSLNGQSLVLYHVIHSQFSSFMTQRIQLTNTPNKFQLILKGLNGSTIAHFQQHTPFSVTDKILDYDPNKDLLNQPLITLAILGYDQVNMDIAVSAKKITPTQISCDIILRDQGRLKAHFTSKFKPQHPQQTVWHNLKQQTIPMSIAYLDPELKERLDAYTSSKQLPFLTEEHFLPFSFLQK